ncbi:MAG: acetyl-CoA carboxylase biotin carboxyl carrier protein subunit [Deltaproteobacteria bacterium]
MNKDQELIILEVMKMEIPITSPAQGVVTEILISEGASVLEGDVLAIIESSL